MKILKKEEVIPVFIGIMFIVSTILLIAFKMDKKESLSQNLEYTDAVVVGFSSGPRLRRYIDYEFFVDGTKYQGSGKYYSKNKMLVVGDTIFVVYDKKNPENNKTYQDFR